VRVPPYHYATDRQLKIEHARVIDRAKLNRYFQRGATVMLDDAQAAIPALDRLCTDLSVQSGVPAAGTIFASPPHAEGFALHQDAEDVIIVQLAGTKSWTVFPPLMRRESSMLRRSECGEPIIDTKLQVGDIVLLPKGSPHKTASTSAVGSVHLTVGLYKITLREALLRFIGSSPDTRLDLPVPKGPDGLGEIALSWLAATLGADGSQAVPGLVDAVEELRTRLRGDTSDFRLLVGEAGAEGGTYRLLRKITDMTGSFLAAQLDRRDDQQLRIILAALYEKAAGETFTYRQFAIAADGILAEEVLHELLRMRLIAHVWPVEGRR
jgi:hypothetical protein